MKPLPLIQRESDNDPYFQFAPEIDIQTGIHSVPPLTEEPDQEAPPEDVQSSGEKGMWDVLSVRRLQEIYRDL